MNSFIETLNGWGGNCLSVAWPMLWQSSLLIALMFALDFLLARKIRAAVRYALWLAVLLKLLLPPALALPTGAAWWLRPAPAIAKTPAAKHFTVTYDDTPMQPYVAPPTVTMPTPPPRLEMAGWVLLASATVSFGLLAWLALRWWQVARMVRNAVAAEHFCEHLGDALQLAGAPSTRSARSQVAHQQAEQVLGAPNARIPVRLKIIESQMSPAVCGLLRPTILLPRTLAENLSPAQLRAVLLHEIFHLRRRDVWVNCAQALLQIFYWWHPLLWVANARIRRVREEAVDDAVMLALRDEADAYAPTLLEVAKLAFRRPLMSLGLVGIMESRSALRQRIERLVDFRAPRCAGLTFASLCGIFVFSAVVLPMGGAPAPAEKKSLPDAVATTPPAVMNQTNPTTILVTAHFVQMSKGDFQNVSAGLQLQRGTANEGSWGTASPQAFSWLLAQLKSSGLKQMSAPRAVTISGSEVEMSIGNGTNEMKFDCTPVATNGGVNLTLFYRVVAPQAGNLVTNQFHAVASLQDRGGIVVSSAGENEKVASNLVALVSVEIVTNPASFQPRLQSVIKRADGSLTNTTPSQRIILDKINHIGFQSIAYDGLPLSEVLRQLSEKIRQTDPDSKGINFLINPNVDESGATIISSTNGASGGGALDIGQFTVKLNLVGVRLADVLDAIVDVARNPNPSDPRKIKYAIKDYGIVFQPKNAETPQLFVRVFKLDTNVFLPHLGFNPRAKMGTNAASAISRAAGREFTHAGVNLGSPAGKAVHYDDRTGSLLVRATSEDLDLIEKTIQALMDAPPQIHIKARFIEVPRGANGASGFNRYLGQINMVTNVSGTGGSSPPPNVPVSAASPLGIFPGSPAASTGVQPNSVPVAAPITGILSDPNFRVVLHAMENQPGFENLGEPEVTTLSGRQTQMRVTEIQTIVTNVVFQETATNYGPMPQTTTVETGPMLDVVPYVLADGYTINLALIPSVTEFLGYEKSTNTTTAHNRAGDKIDLPKILPRVAVRQLAATVNLWDNQTVVLGGMSLTNVSVSKDKVPVLGDIQVIGHLFRSQHKTAVEKDVLVFITATIVDPAGNRVHADDDLPFAQKGVPPQPANR